MTTLLDFAGLADTRSIQERFEAFHRANEHVLAKLVELAREARAAGMKKCGISLLWERARWYWSVETHGDDYKLNNLFRSRYARLMEQLYPDEFGNGFFETRQLKAE